MEAFPRTTVRLVDLVEDSALSSIWKKMSFYEPRVPSSGKVKSASFVRVMTQVKFSSSYHYVKAA